MDVRTLLNATMKCYSVWNIQHKYIIACKSGKDCIYECNDLKYFDVNCQNRNGWTALMYASYDGDEKAVRMLLESRVDVKYSRCR